LKVLPTVDIVQGLDIEGKIIAAFRGKELVFAISKVLYSYFYSIVMPTFNFFKFIFRVCYSLEGHSFWVPTAIYDTIVYILLSIVARKARLTTLHLIYGMAYLVSKARFPSKQHFVVQTGPYFS
jgi:hypothetical protein